MTNGEVTRNFRIRHKRGDVVVFREEHIPRYGGKRATILRVSRITGDITVQLLDRVSEAIDVGQVVTVKPYEVRSATQTRGRCPICGALDCKRPNCGSGEG